MNKKESDQYSEKEAPLKSMVPKGMPSQSKKRQAIKRKRKAPNAKAHDIDTRWASFVDYMGGKVSKEALQGAGQWHDRLVVNPDSVLTAATPSPGDDRKRQAEIESWMKNNDDRYWADEATRVEYHDILDRLNDASEISDAASLVTPSWDRMVALEKMMADPHSDYYEGANSASLKAEYLSLLDNAGAMPTPSNGGSTPQPVQPQDTARADEIAKLNESINQRNAAMFSGGLDNLDLSEPTAPEPTNTGE